MGKQTDGFRVTAFESLFPSWRPDVVELTAVVVDELLQAAELRARCDVEASAVQLPDLVVLHV